MEGDLRINDGVLGTQSHQGNAGIPRQDGPQLDRNQFLAREVKIKPLNHGYFVEVGCQQFAVESPQRLLAALTEYLADPHGVEGRWMTSGVKPVSLQ